MVILILELRSVHQYCSLVPYLHANIDWTRIPELPRILKWSWNTPNGWSVGIWFALNWWSFIFSKIRIGTLHELCSINGTRNVTRSHISRVARCVPGHHLNVFYNMYWWYFLLHMGSACSYERPISDNDTLSLYHSGCFVQLYNGMSM